MYWSCEYRHTYIYMYNMCVYIHICIMNASTYKYVRVRE